MEKRTPPAYCDQATRDLHNNHSADLRGGDNFRKLHKDPQHLHARANLLAA